MGEAKRRSKLVKHAEGELQQRLAAGEFGAPGQALRYCIVVDKSQRGKDLLLSLAALPAFAGLRTLFEGESFRLWDVSALFPYLVLRSGEGQPASRTLLAPDLPKLLGETLPRAWRQAAQGGHAPGAIVAVDESRQDAVQQTLTRLRSITRTDKQ